MGFIKIKLKVLNYTTNAGLPLDAKGSLGGPLAGKWGGVEMVLYRLGLVTLPLLPQSFSGPFEGL